MPTAEAARAWDRANDFEKWPRTEEPSAISEPNPELKAEIEKGKKLLQSAADCDDEESEHYSSETFDRAVEFLTMHADFLRQFGLDLPVPTVGGGPDGSIDLHWRRASWELLVNIPSDGTTMASFYGDNYGVQKIKGSVDPNTCNLGLAAWLMS